MIPTSMAFDELIPPPFKQVYINDIGCVVMSLETLKSITNEEIAEQMFLGEMERELKKYGRLRKFSNERTKQ